ncbi:MAG: 6-phosphogluconolactonase, partial [Chloroflexi bacterium]|nr:6-phosphogluconolactonase [Chloroflexota bacterium]
MTPDRHVHILPDAEGVARASAAFVVGVAAEDLGSRAATHFRIAFAGGTTPRRTYELLAEGEFGVSWDRWEVFWGDERFVPNNDLQSNYGMARRALLDRVSIPSHQIHPMQVEFPTPDAAAIQYQ